MSPAPATTVVYWSDPDVYKKRGHCCSPNSPQSPTDDTILLLWNSRFEPLYSRRSTTSSPSEKRREEKKRKEKRELDRSELAKLEEADQEPGGETAEQRNKFLVLRLYEALNGRDHAAVQDLLAPDLEWWFHGPPKHQQHMMRLLTTGGAATAAGLFRFVPRSVDAFGSTVIAESQEGSVYWVHAWTVGPDGVITQLREYFNTDLTVTRLAAAAATKCVWQSRRPDSKTNSLPGLLLAI